MQKLIIICGIPGSGKSTLAKLIIDSYEPWGIKCAICSADDYFIDRAGEYKFDVLKLGKAHEFCREQCLNAIKDWKSIIIIDNTNLTQKERQPYIDMADEHGYEVEIIKTDTPWANNAEECFKRNTHGVPLETIKKMIQRMDI